MLTENNYKKQRNKVKKEPQIGEAFKVITKSSLWLSNFINYTIWSLNSFTIQFWYKILSLLFFSSWFVRGERILDFGSRERKSMLTPILATKIVNFCIKKFHLIRKVSLRCLFTLKLPKNPNLSSERFLILSFLCWFWFFKAIYKFIKVFKLFSWYFG